MDALFIDLEPSLVARVAAESFDFDSSRAVLPPLYGMNVPELRSAMLAVDAELRAGSVGGSLLAESFATVLAVHLIRHITGPNRELAAADGVLPHHKLRRVIEYIMENLEGIRPWRKWRRSSISALITSRGNSRRPPGWRRTSM
jgi:AraC family transcriptional regulator